MQGAMLITWGNPVRGREAKSLEVFGHALQYFEEHAKAGRIHGHREYFCLTGPAERAGLMVIDGEVEELQKILISEENQRLLAEAGSVVDNFDVAICIGGSDQAVAEGMAIYTDTVNKLGYM